MNPSTSILQPLPLFLDNLEPSTLWRTGTATDTPRTELTWRTSTTTAWNSQHVQLGLPYRTESSPFPYRTNLIPHKKLPFLGMKNSIKKRSAEPDMPTEEIVAGSLVLVEVWNMYDTVLAGLSRSNNLVEGWHKSFQKLVGCFNPALWTFLTALKEENLTFSEKVNCQDETWLRA